MRALRTLEPGGGLVAGGLIAYASSANIDAALAARLRRIGRVAFGACALVFGRVHFLYATDTASMLSLIHI